MNIAKSILGTMFVSAFMSAPVFADEVGGGKPGDPTNTTTTTTTTTATTTNSVATVECGWIKAWLGTCENSSDTTSE